MTDAFDILLRHVDENSSSISDHEYYYFEPWDITAPREDWQIELAKEDGVELLSTKNSKVYGLPPMEFQSGIVYNSNRISLTIAATQSGKTFAELIRDVATATGEFPYSMRYDRGKDTGVPRKVTAKNIIRWGRFDSLTGEKIDHDASKMREYMAGNREWNCGNIVGSGKMPLELVAPDGAKYWIGTTRRAYVEMWLPSLNIHSKENCIIPPHFIDTTRGNKGYSAINQMVHFNRGIDFSFITYESGAVKFEAKRVFRIALDEEPPNREIFTAALTHCQSLAIITTPYKGITWLKEIIEKEMDGKRVYHCTQFDCPYLLKDDVLSEREATLPHERAARVWGFPVTQNRATPVFNTLKLNLWMQNHKPKYSLGRFEATSIYDKIVPNYTSRLPCLMDTPVKLAVASDEDIRYVWRIYESPQPKTPYVITADVAGGVEDVNDAGLGKISSKDWGAAIIFRPADKNKGEKWPQPVAQIRSTLPDIEFARVCLLAARHYNNATLAPEGARMSGANAAFINEIKDWPYWYMHGTEMWSMRKAQVKKGFDTNVTTRDALFSLIRDWEESYTAEQEPNYVDECLLDELAGAIYNKKGRPDHAPGGKNDLTIAFGIGLYVFKNAPEQFRCNVKEEQAQDRWLDRIRQPKEEYEGLHFHRFR